MLRKCVLWYMVFAVCIMGIVPRVEAGFVSSTPVVSAAVERATDLEKIRATLEEKIVRQRLGDLGFTAEEITTRVSSLTDDQLHRFARALDEVRVGRDGGVVIGIIVVALLVGIIFLFVTGRLAIN